VPESKVRAGAEQKRKLRRLEQAADVQREKERKGLPGERNWVPPLFISCLLLGVAWLVITNIAPDAPVIASLKNWNIFIGISLIGSSFVLMTLWK